MENQKTPPTPPPDRTEYVNGCFHPTSVILITLLLSVIFSLFSCDPAPEPDQNTSDFMAVYTFRSPDYFIETHPGITCQFYGTPPTVRYSVKHHMAYDSTMFWPVSGVVYVDTIHLLDVDMSNLQYLWLHCQQGYIVQPDSFNYFNVQLYQDGALIADDSNRTATNNTFNRLIISQ